MALLSSLQGLPGERGVAGPEGKPVSGVGSRLARLCGVSVCLGGVPAMVCVMSVHPSVFPPGAISGFRGSVPGVWVCGNGSPVTQVKIQYSPFLFRVCKVQGGPLAQR